ncbi:MAG: DNA/RNA nuclease SfsA [Hyphomicrobiaceae bacterium]
MKFLSPLLRGTLVQRYKRFLADVRLATGETITATCPNTGSMLGLTSPGSTVWLSVSDSPTRKYPHTWEIIEADLGKGPALVGINTGHPNRLVADAIEAGLVPELTGFATMRREVRYGKNSRIDLLLETPGSGCCYVEVKNVHLARASGLAEFPDCVTERGMKHLAELSDMVKAGHRAAMVYLVQRGDCERLAIARDIDPAYADAFDKARKKGVEMLCLACEITPEEIRVARALPIDVGKPVKPAKPKAKR